MDIIQQEETDFKMDTNETRRSTLVLQQAVLPSLIGLIIALINLAAILILAQCKRMNHQIRLMSINLAVTDLMTGVAILIDAFLPTMLEEGLCRFLMYFYCIGVVVSFLTITGMLVDRFVALYFPFGYLVLLGKERSLGIILGIWFTGLILTAVNFFDGFQAYQYQDFVICAQYTVRGKTGLLTVTAIFCFLIVVDVVLYMLMFIKMYKISGATSGLETLTREKQFKYQARILIKLSAILGCFMLLYTPMIIINIIDIINTDPSNKRVILTWQSFAGLLVLLNSFINPFLYVWRYTECRYTFLMIICCCNKNRREKYRKLKKHFFEPYLVQTSSTAITSK
ncbi:beta-2 adrenergic receptor-like [Saccostrea cucullata]|uniref:beta-2 adrenergic receptor-like n=1 Tax=Saccostrea cuccullata TaxID=36930 RepID=UPI002ED37982